MTIEQTRIFHCSQYQAGAALATALIMLLVLTVVGVSALNTITMEETMAGNLRDQIVAFQATETGLSEAEAKFDTDWWYTTKISPDCLDGANPAICDGTQNGSVFYSGAKQPFEDNVHNDAFWEAANGAIQYTGAAINGVAADPAYFVEKTGIGKSDSWGSNYSYGQQDGRKLYFTSTARGKGGNPNTVSMLQVTTAVRDL